MLIELSQVRTELVKKKNELHKQGLHSEARGVETSIKVLDTKSVSVDAERVVHAYWIDQGHALPPECSNCGSEPHMQMTWARPDFCPSCGAWMDADDPKNQDDGGFGDF